MDDWMLYQSLSILSINALPIDSIPNYRSTAPGWIEGIKFWQKEAGLRISELPQPKTGGRPGPPAPLRASLTSVRYGLGNFGIVLELLGFLVISSAFVSRMRCLSATLGCFCQLSEQTEIQEGWLRLPLRDDGEQSQVEVNDWNLE